MNCVTTAFLVAMSAGALSARAWPEREVPELIRWAEGVVGSRWSAESRSYELHVAPGYRARLTARCHTGGYEAMVMTRSGRVLGLLLPYDDESSTLLGPGEYLVFLVGHADDSEYSLDVHMRRITPGAK